MLHRHFGDATLGRCFDQTKLVRLVLGFVYELQQRFIRFPLLLGGDHRLVYDIKWFSLLAVAWILASAPLTISCNIMSLNMRVTSPFDRQLHTLVRNKTDLHIKFLLQCYVPVFALKYQCLDRFF